MNLFYKNHSPETGQAIEESYENANFDWIQAAENTLWQFCRKKRFVTSDDILERLERSDKRTHNNSALGGVFVKAKNNGWIKPYGYTSSRRRSRHQAPIRVWKSLINKGGKSAF